MGWSAMADRTLRQALRTFRQDLGALYRRPGQPDTVLKDVVFDDTFFAVNNSTGVEVSSKQPVMGVRTADLPADRRAGRDTVVITRGTTTYTFKITDVQPDGEAGTTLFLQSITRI